MSVRSRQRGAADWRLVGLGLLVVVLIVVVRAAVSPSVEARREHRKLRACVLSLAEKPGSAELGVEAIRRAIYDCARERGIGAWYRPSMAQLVVTPQGKVVVFKYDRTVSILGQDKVLSFEELVPVLPSVSRRR